MAYVDFLLRVVSLSGALQSRIRSSMRVVCPRVKGGRQVDECTLERLRRKNIRR